MTIIAAEAYIVEKANKCLDFTVTVFMFHLFFTWMIYKFPQEFYWWLSHFFIVTVTVLVSEYFCLRLETAEIKLSVHSILEKGKEIGLEGAKKLMDKGITKD